MRFGLMIEPQQGLSYLDQLELARLAERLGFETIFRSDHYGSFPGPVDGATTDAWTVLAGLARETQRIRLGVLVSPATFRHPGSFAKVVTTVDEMSGGRVDVGVGAGWNEGEHRRLGLPFPEMSVRGDMLEDQLAILHGLWDEPDGWTYEGRTAHVESALFRPKPVGRPHPPIILGGSGRTRSLRLAARYADEYNLGNPGPEACGRAYRRLDEECRLIGRDPATMVKSVMLGLVIGKTRAEYERRVGVFLATTGGREADRERWLADRQGKWLLGTPDEARAVMARYAEAGAERIMFQDLLPRDHAMIELAAGELIRSR